MRIAFLTAWGRAPVAARQCPYPNNRRKRDELRLKLYAEQGGACHLGPGCYLLGQPMKLTQQKDGLEGPLFATFDHIIPVAKGGTRHRSNFALAHKHCNSKRGDKDILLC